MSQHGFKFRVDHTGTHPHRTNQTDLWRWLLPPNRMTSDDHTDHIDQPVDPVDTADGPDSDDIDGPDSDDIDGPDSDDIDGPDSDDIDGVDGDDTAQGTDRDDSDDAAV